MEKFDQNIINEIAQELDCGNDCYYNIKTKELICLLNPNAREMGDEEYYMEMFKDDFSKIKKQRKNLIKFEVLESYESFKIMEDFKNEIKDEQFKEKLNEALNKRKPFQNFKYLIDTSEFRESWFAFKQMELEKIVVNTIERYSAST